MTDSRYFFDLALRISEGFIPGMQEYETIVNLPSKDVFLLFQGADHLREMFSGRKLTLCAIKNSKSGQCPENCRFCAQSSWWKVRETPYYPLADFGDVEKGAVAASRSAINRYSLVNSGKGPSKKETEILSSYIESFPKEGTGYCASLGIMNKEGLEKLKKSGLSRYHHNLETSRSFFSSICTTHSYDERVATITAAKEAGLEVCSGGIFGMGETWTDILEMALDLKRLEVDAVPVNFLVPIKGTPLENRKQLRPSECLKIISLLRYVLPDREIIICAGRESVIGSFQNMCIWAGASGIMTGNYLTVAGPEIARDIKMIGREGFQIKEKTDSKKENGNDN